ncbi:cell division protein FtsZ [Bacillus sp. FJAT-27225]|uniref:tubulin-like doman-containing protein n=1 Tax=Bacillus sp. FJAT-27225 TaxID=1743144 RepID=UPI00080C357F|nr:tubulin-like doman-containing protein [Bacillus sp. FJAT-27225]OCA90422.1 cell division protein FtsZ [Bacillus sp. FJAT-27225]
MKPIGILGVGQAGGNIAEAASALGFPTALINTNQRDGLVNTRVENKFFVPGYNGAGQDRSIGARAVNDNYREIVEFVKKSFKKVKFLLVAFSTDGGTGSGMSPLLIEILLNQLPGLKVGAIAVVPERNVLAGNRINAAECLEELSKIDGISSTFLVDNDQLRRINPQSSKQQIYLASNQKVMGAINHVLQITQKSSLYGNFDETDLMNILCTRGVTVISTSTVTDAKTTSDVSLKIQQSWANSVFCPVESPGVIRAGLIYEGPENVSKLINIPSIFERVGEPLELYEGTYISETDPSITTILAGLSFPTRRLQVMEDMLIKNRDRLHELVQKEYTQKYESKIGWASNLKARNNPRPTRTVNHKPTKSNS